MDWRAVLEILDRPTLGGVFVELVMFFGPLWIAVLVGLIVGWAWRPKWANLGKGKSGFVSETAALEGEASSSEGSVLSSLGLNSVPSFNSIRMHWPQNLISWISDDRTDKDVVDMTTEVADSKSSCSASRHENEKLVVASEDLEHLCQLVEVKDGGPTWIQMMDRSLATMSYQAWRRDPETGPPQYRSRTVFEDATPELVRDFFWDDEFRAKWDDMLIHTETLEECPTTGTMVVHWVRKFPFFCSNREYIIGRRIWESGRAYYCVTKGIPYSSVPRRNTPRRVDLYYSSWCIRAVESRKGDGQLTACEVLLFHHEDMGIPWEIAKLGIRQGMWGAVKKIEPGLRAYQMGRKSGMPLSRSAFMAQINTKVNADYLLSLETANDSSDVERLNSKENRVGRNIPKFLIVGGAVALACSLDRGLLTKAVIFGVARRFAKVGKRL